MRDLDAATGDGDRGGGGSVILFEEDLSLLEPDPTPAPEWARNWWSTGP